jgi:two-component system LytT family response regulator
MIRTLIIDDSPLVREGIRLLLQGEQDIEVVGEAADGPEAVSAITSLRPDLVFLDIKMPGCDGFEVLDRAGSVHLCEVIFVTAYDKYALQAFEANALAYLMKPIARASLQKALARARRVLASQDELARTHAKVAEVIQSRGVPPLQPAAGFDAREGIQRLVVKHRDRFILLKTDDVDWIGSAGNYIELHVGTRSYLLHMTTNDIESTLDPRRFARIHRSTIVNIDRVREVKVLGHGDFDVILADETVLRMSRGYRDRLLN